MFIDKMTNRKNFQQDRNSITVDSIEIDFPLMFEGNGKMYFCKLDRSCISRVRATPRPIKSFVTLC